MPESHRNDVKSLFDWLGVSGESTKNLVPVDWLSQAVIKIFNRPQLHNQTYHLTHPRTVSVVELAAAMVSAIQKEADVWQAMKYSASETIAVDDIKRVFLDSFQNYFANDPAFDHRNVIKALPNFEAPRLTHDCLERMFRYAIRQRFMDAEHAIPSGSTPASLPSVATSNQVAKPVFPHAWSLTVVDRSGPCETDGDQPYASATDNSRVVSHIVFDSHSSGSDVNGSHQHPQIFVRRPVLPLIESGEMTIEHAMRSGCLVAFGTADSKNVALEQLRTCLAHPFGKTLLADRIFSNPCRDVNLSLCGQVGEQ
jgi:hypothetical protein